MASSLRKTMVFLGLSDDDRDSPRQDDYEEYEAEGLYDEYVDEEPEPVMEAKVTPLRSAPEPLDEVADTELRRIVTIHPTSYNDAKAIGAAFRDGVPVIINLSELGDADAKRLVDFSAGLIFGLHGSIERVTAKVFLLTPEFVEVGTSETSGTDAQASFFNQS